MEIKRGATVRIKHLDNLLVDETIDPIFLNSRRQHMVGTIDSPIYLKYNHHWFIKHITSRFRGSLSIGKYGVYHESEFEVIEPLITTKPLVEKEPLPTFDDDTWDNV